MFIVWNRHNKLKVNLYNMTDTDQKLLRILGNIYKCLKNVYFCTFDKKKNQALLLLLLWSL